VLSRFGQPTLYHITHHNEYSQHITVADLGLLKGGFRFRRITVIARIVSSWQASTCTNAESAKSAPIARSAGAIDPAVVETASSVPPPPVRLIASFCSWLVELTTVHCRSLATPKRPKKTTVYLAHNGSHFTCGRPSCN